ncbi:38fae7fe-1683-4242-9269-88f145d6e98a [Thermothielavioides terrestris]|uniref:38fae7fe-1683-4242-9269-88f145d6e98a n=1 Tax=Thermothielavioides terrestris TaxID=2587410 RepID=A0A446B543_9PEZI|nr:38fae7fe-1683-4242-9269-88f145d6e98a [Thermothielavioides terrestris]
MAGLLSSGRRDAANSSVAVSAVPSLAQSIHCSQTSHRGRRTRAKLTSEERERVLGVRRQGACLRCRLLKIQCSLGNPCQPCLQSAVRGSERKVLSFCYCVRTRFADVNIFRFRSAGETASAIGMQTETLLLDMSNLLSRIGKPARFSFTSSPAAFNSTMVSWLTDPDFRLPNGSIVGLCCSSLLGLQFRQETANGDAANGDAATDDLLTDFRRFLLATSLAHAGWRDGGKALRTRDLCAAGQVSGYRLLRRLDRVLTPQFLARCERESCQVLFLLVLGAVLGVGYSSSSLLEGDASPAFPAAAAETLLSPEFRRSPTLWLAMKEHLCQMLAHHLIFIGSMLGIRLDTALEQRIIETAVTRWNKAEEFVWAEMVGVAGPSAVKVPGNGDVKTEEEEGDTMGGSPSTKRPPALPPPARDNEPPWSPLEAQQLVPIPCPEISQFPPQQLKAGKGRTRLQ